MRVTFLVGSLAREQTLHASLVTQGRLLAERGHEVTLLEVLESDRAPRGVGSMARAHVVGRTAQAAWADRPPGEKACPSTLVPQACEADYPADVDEPLRRVLTSLATDVLVTAGPGLVGAAATLLPADVALWYQEHRPAGSLAGLEHLAVWAPRIDVLTTTTTGAGRRIRTALGACGPDITTAADLAWCRSMPDFRPRSTLDSDVIVAMGPLVARNPFAHLVRGFAQVADELPGWRLRIVGEGPGRAALARFVHKYALHDRVELPGRLPDGYGEWARAGVAVHDSRNRDLPVVLRDAMGAGVPVVAFDDGAGARDLVEDGANGLLVPARSVVGVGTALAALARDEGLRHRLGSGAYDWFRRSATEPDVARWEELLSTARGRRTSPGGTVGSAAVRPVVTTAPSTRPPPPRGAVLGAVLDAARRASDSWFVIPPYAGRAPVVVLPLGDRSAFLGSLGAMDDALCAVDPGDVAEERRWAPLGDVADVLGEGRTTWLRVQPHTGDADTPEWTLAEQVASVEVEFWVPRFDGWMVAPRPNRYQTSVDPGVVRFDEALVDGVATRTLPVMNRPTVHDCRFPVDVVYTWVDAEDPAWAAAREERLRSLGRTVAARESSGRARYTSRDELRYSLRSVALFAPWVRHVFLVTDGQRPRWLDDHDRVTVVDHREILPPEALPTFNSHAIETALHRIPDLARQWIYFNDDVFLGRPVSPESFFTAAGQPRVFPGNLDLGAGDGPDLAPWELAAHNNRRLLEEAHGAINPTALLHVPHAHDSAVVADVERRWPDAVRRTRESPFRSGTDVSLLSSLAQHHGLATGAAVPAECASAYVDISGVNVDTQLEALLARDVDFFCLGDHHQHAVPAPELRAILDGFLQRYLPVAAPWEVDQG